MVLHPLEFSECYLDSPWFRENVQQYEEELEITNSQIKQLIKDARNMVNAFVEHEKTVKVFSQSLRRFQFDCIGENLTDDERGIAGSLNEFGLMLEEVTQEWSRTIARLSVQLIPPLESFRKNQICSYRDLKKSFEKASERYYKQLDHALGMSHKKKDLQLLEADNEVLSLKKVFHKEALNYVNKLQEVEERKKFEFVEYLLMFMQVYFNYFHQTHETAKDCKNYMSNLQTQLVTTRNQYEGTRLKTEELMQKMLDQPDSDECIVQALGDQWSRAGYLLLMEKNALSTRLASKWTKCFCMYMKESKKFRVVLAPQSSFNAVVSAKVVASFGNPNNSTNAIFSEPMTVKTCTRRMTDSLDRRFCFDLELEDNNGKLTAITFQALSEHDRKNWMCVMDGKEPEYVTTRVLTSKEDLCKLNEIGLQFVTNVIQEIEHRGLKHEGLYRLVGVTSKVDLLLQNALSPVTAPSVDYSNEDEWETNTLTSALKSYFRNLPEPVMTFDLHRSFINAAKCEMPEDRVKSVATLVGQLPEANQKVLAKLTEHLEKVQDHHEANKMTIQNLGVCFGPTLLRDRHETVQAILEIKFSNVIVEIITEERRLLFEGGTMMASSEGNDGGDGETVTSPRIYTKTIAHVPKPSQRFRSRPGGGIYTITSLHNILDETGQEGKASFDKPVFPHRHRAFRQNSRIKGLSASNERADDESSSSSESEHEYEQVSRAPKPADRQNASRPDISLIDFSPIEGPLNGKIKSSSATSLKSSSSRFSKQKRITTEQDDGCSDKEKVNVKMRISPRMRRNVLHSSKSKHHEGGDGLSENTNNSNGKPALPAKPSPVIVSDTMKRRRKKILQSMKEGIPSPRIPNKNAIKKVLPLRSESAKSVKRSKSTGSDLSKKRPNSEFAPPAFRLEESDVKAKIAELKPKLPERNYEKWFDQEISDVPVRSITPDNISTGTFSDGDANDDTMASAVARTLYACDGEDENELSFKPGQLIRELKKSDEPGWLVGTLNGKVGLVPRNYIAFI